MVSCSADDALVDIVGRMREMSISCVNVVDGAHPTAILTDRDLPQQGDRRWAPGRLRVPRRDERAGDHHRRGTTCSQALYRMSRHGIHRLVVVDCKGALAGIVTVTDLLRLRAHSAPPARCSTSRKVESIDALRELHQRIQQLIVHLASTRHRNPRHGEADANPQRPGLVRLIDLLRRDRYRSPPTSPSW